VQAADDAEDLQGPLAGDPGADEVVHAERVDVAQVEGREGFGGFVAVALGDVAIDTGWENVSGVFLVVTVRVRVEGGW